MTDLSAATVSRYLTLYDVRFALSTQWLQSVGSSTSRVGIFVHSITAAGKLGLSDELIDLVAQIRMLRPVTPCRRLADPRSRLPELLSAQPIALRPFPLKPRDPLPTNATLGCKQTRPLRLRRHGSNLRYTSPRLMNSMHRLRGGKVSHFAQIANRRELVRMPECGLAATDLPPTNPPDADFRQKLSRTFHRKLDRKPRID